MLIFASQLGNFLGIVSAPAGFTELVLGASGHLAEAKPWVVLVASATLAIGALSQRVLPKIPPMLTAMVLEASRPSCSTRRSARAHGACARSAPCPARCRPLVPGCLGGDASKPSAGRHRRRTGVADAGPLDRPRHRAQIGTAPGQQQEFIAQVLHVAAAFFSGFPTSASANRCGINYDAGAKTPMSAISRRCCWCWCCSRSRRWSRLPADPVVAGILFLVAGT